MGVTTYYSVGGEIIGERSGGVRTDYLRDALGSVTATKRTDRGTISNTYRYKPYGERLAKTGVAADPRFQWVGTAGYRETAISHSKSYVRARHLGQEEGLWTTVDPLWPSESKYGYVHGCSPLLVDSSGLKISWCRTSPLPFWGTGPCGSFHVRIRFNQSRNENGLWDEGWIVQFHKIRYEYISCLSDVNEGLCREDFAEGWKVTGGRLFAGEPLRDVTDLKDHDSWSGREIGVCTSGYKTIESELRLVPLAEFEKWKWKVGGAGPCAYGLHSKLGKPPLWETYPLLGKRFAKILHGCCCSADPESYKDCNEGLFLRLPIVIFDPESTNPCR